MSDDDYGFWDADRQHSLTGPVPRLKRPARPAGTREHTTEVAVQHVSRRPGAPNPLTRRLGALCAVGLLAVPVALIMRGSNNDAMISAAEAAAAPTISTVQSTVAPAAVAAVPAETAVVQAAPATVAPIAVDTATIDTVAAVVETSAAVVEIPDATVAAAPVEPTSIDSTPVASTSAVRIESADTARSVGIATPVAEKRRACDVAYAVAAGDYWISIAKNWSVKLADLLSANGATVATPIYPGGSICLPAGATPPTTAAPTTTVKPTPTTTAKTTPTTTKPKPTPTTTKPTSTTTKPKPTATTAPPTTAAPSTTAAPPANNFSRADVEQIIRNVWPDDLEDEAVRIATRESNLIPTVRNSCCYGLFQIYFTANKSSLASWGITSAAELYDPQVNAYAAYAMYLRAGGWGPWAL